MTPARLNLTITRGIHLGPIQIVCKDAARVVVDLTGWTVEAEGRRSAGTTPVDTLAFAVTDAEAGEVTLEMTDEATLALTARKNWRWDLVFIDPTGRRLGPYVAGTYEVVDNITQPAD
jgi:hypothetical protein